MHDTQVRIKDFVKGGPDSETESCQHNEAEWHREPLASEVQVAFPLPLTYIAFDH